MYCGYQVVFGLLTDEGCVEGGADFVDCDTYDCYFYFEFYSEYSPSVDETPDLNAYDLVTSQLVDLVDYPYGPTPPVRIGNGFTSKKSSSLERLYLFGGTGARLLRASGVVFERPWRVRFG